MKKLKNLKKTAKTVTVYTLVDDFTVEVERNEDVTDFYMCKIGYGVKIYMFGIPNCPPAVAEELVRANAEEYMAFFVEMHTEK